MSFSLRRSEGRQTDRARERDTEKSRTMERSCSSADRKAMKRSGYLTKVLEEISMSVAPGGLPATLWNALNLKLPYPVLVFAFRAPSI